jgi:hypothetical protein
MNKSTTQRFSQFSSFQYYTINIKCNVRTVLCYRNKVIINRDGIYIYIYITFGSLLHLHLYQYTYNIWIRVITHNAINSNRVGTIVESAVTRFCT